MNLLEYFANAEKKVQVAANQIIFNEGESGDTMYVVLSGTVKIIVRSQIVDLVKAGSVFGEMGAISNSQRSATATAQTDCTLVRIDHAELLALIKRTPEFALHVMQILSERLREMNEHSLYYLGAKGKS